jgi:hypothetical protein
VLIEASNVCVDQLGSDSPPKICHLKKLHAPDQPYDLEAVGSGMSRP